MALRFSRSAVKALQDMPTRERQQLLTRLKAIAADPAGRHASVTALQGTEGGFRVRQGDWRAIFHVDGDDVLVDGIGHRREIYR